MISRQQLSLSEIGIGGAKTAPRVVVIATLFPGLRTQMALGSWVLGGLQGHSRKCVKDCVYSKRNPAMEARSGESRTPLSCRARASSYSSAVLAAWYLGESCQLSISSSVSK
jgi:hypothetical protein